jgi:transcriptional regulator with XRE-family HTH domain
VAKIKEVAVNPQAIGALFTTQEELAKASMVSRPMIAAMEAGRKRGGIAALKKLAGALTVDLDYLA